MDINEKEFAVIREISDNHRPVQRDIAKKVGISLGLTNIIIKRLIKKGYIKIREVPPRTIIYMLTPKGLAEKARKSYHFTLKTMDVIRNIKENIHDIVNKAYKNGARQFIILGNNELATFIEITLRDLNFMDANFKRSDDELEKDSHKCHLIVSNKEGMNDRLDIIQELSNRGVYY